MKELKKEIIELLGEKKGKKAYKIIKHLRKTKLLKKKKETFILLKLIKKLSEKNADVLINLISKSKTKENHEK